MLCHTLLSSYDMMRYQEQELGGCLNLAIADFQTNTENSRRLFPYGSHHT